MDILRIILQNVKDIANLKRRICCISNNGTILLPNLPVYADNAAAITGGLEIGALYRTGDIVKVVH